MAHASIQSSSEHWADKIKRLSAEGDQQGVANLIDGIRRHVDNVGAFDRLWQQFVQSADACGLPIEVTKEQALDLFWGQGGLCAFTGLPINFSRDENAPVRASSEAFLGRIDASRGYVLGNVWWLHRDAGRMRGDLPLPRFLELCRLTAERQAAGVAIGLSSSASSAVPSCGPLTPTLMVARFLHDRTEADPVHRETSAALWQAFLDWCEMNNAQPCTRTAFGRGLRSGGYVRNAGHVLTWGGLRLMSAKVARVAKVKNTFA